MSICNTSNSPFNYESDVQLNPQMEYARVYGNVKFSGLSLIMKFGQCFHVAVSNTELLFVRYDKEVSYSVSHLFLWVTGLICSIILFL